jgi:HAD superfamily phosphatase (TIGR01668 family)
MLESTMLLKPDLVVEAASEVDLSLLRSHGRSALIVDLDDTIVPSNSNSMAPSYRHWFQKLGAENVPILILSNGRPERVRYWAHILGVDGLALVGKPFGFAFQRGLKRLGCKASETAMIGDQLFTDVLGANITGMLSILVRPLTTGLLPHTRLIRKLEDIIIRRR